MGELRRRGAWRARARFGEQVTVVRTTPSRSMDLAALPHIDQQIDRFRYRADALAEGLPVQAAEARRMLAYLRPLRSRILRRLMRGATVRRVAAPVTVRRMASRQRTPRASRRRHTSARRARAASASSDGSSPSPGDPPSLAATSRRAS